jgi:hypothetical protein
MLKKTSHRLGLALLALLGAPVLLLNSALAPEPSVSLTADVTTGDIARVINLVREHDPRRVRPGRQERVVLRERDIDVLFNHIAYRRLGVPVRIELTQGVAEIEGSLHVAANPFGRWLNVQLRLRERAGMPEIESLQVGGLPLPAALGLPLARYAAGLAGLESELEMAGDIVQRVNFLPQNLALSYELQRDSAERIVAALIARPEQERLKAYSDRLVTLAAVAPTMGSSLAGWMGPMFELARQRSAAGGDAAAENRAAILVLTLYANGRNLGSVLPAARHWQRPRPQRLTLAGRDDSPLHLLISAALVVEGTGPLSKAVGLFKEVADSRGASGFSFNDLAADRAGTRLGELAMQQPLRLQTALAGVVQEADFMPHAADLPEAMAEPEFKRRFGGIGEPRYVAMVAEIDRRVSALPALK